MPPKPMSRDRKGFFKEKHEWYRSFTRPRYSSSHYDFHKFKQQRSTMYQQPTGRGGDGGASASASASAGARHNVPNKHSHGRTISAPRVNRDPRQRFWESSNNTSPRWHSKRSIDHVLKPFSHAPHIEDSIKRGNNDDNNNKQKHGTRNESSMEWKPIKWKHSGMFSFREPEKARLLDKDVGGASDATTEKTAKKPRLNWGEGLYKFEKKKNEAVIATTTPLPSSISCTSLAGVDDVLCLKAANLGNDVSNLEVLAADVDILTKLGSSLVKFLKCDNIRSTDSSLARSTIMTKVALCKAVISKVLVATQTEIDSLENELESLLECHNTQSCDEDIGGSNKVTCQKPLHMAPSNERNVETLCNMIISSNKDAAKKANEIYAKLLPKESGKIKDVGLSSNPIAPNATFIKEKFVEKKKFSRFKEKVLATKYRALSYLWRKDLSLRPQRKITSTSQKKLQLRLQIISNCQKNKPSIRNRFRFPGMVKNQLSLVPTPVMLAYTSELLSKSQDKGTRKILKMPTLILDQKDRMSSMFKSSNGLVDDPLAIEKERAMINPWTSDERNIFSNKFATFGKDFKKIASFLDQKTTADCVEFYYKNYKPNCLEKIKKEKDGKSQKLCKAKTGSVASSKKGKCKVNAKSRDVSGEAPVRENGIEGNRRTHSGRLCLWRRDDNAKISTGDDRIISKRSNSHDILQDEGERIAAEVLVGKFGSLSSKARTTRFFITRSVDHVEANKDKACLKVRLRCKQPLMRDVSQNIDDGTSTDKIRDKMDPSDGIDKEKSSFLPMVSSFGKDFTMIAQTRPEDQCKVINDVNGGRSDKDDACVVEVDSVIGSDKSGTKTDKDLPSSAVNSNHDESNHVETENSSAELNEAKESNGKVDHADANMVSNVFYNSNEPIAISMSDVMEARKDKEGAELVSSFKIIEPCHSHFVVEDRLVSKDLRGLPTCLNVVVELKHQSHDSNTAANTSQSSVEIPCPGLTFGAENQAQLFLGKSNYSRSSMQDPFTTENTMLRNTIGAAVQENTAGHVEAITTLQCPPFKEPVKNQVLVDMSSNSSATEFQKVEQIDDRYKTQLQCSSASAKTPKSVVFKLFGKIITIPSSS